MKNLDINTAIIAAGCVLIVLAVVFGCAGIKDAVKDTAIEEEPAALSDYDIQLIKAGGCKIYLSNGSTIDAVQVKSVTQSGGELTLNYKGTYDANYRTCIIPIGQISYILR